MKEKEKENFYFKIILNERERKENFYFKIIFKDFCSLKI